MATGAPGHGDGAGLARVGCNASDSLGNPHVRRRRRDQPARLDTDVGELVDELTPALQTHRAGEDPHALGRRRNPSANHRRAPHRQTLHIGGAFIVNHRRRRVGRRHHRIGDIGGNDLERVAHVLELERQDALELGANRFLELGPTQALEAELEHMEKQLIAGNGGVRHLVGQDCARARGRRARSWLEPAPVHRPAARRAR